LIEVATGFYLFNTDVASFEAFVREDYLVEWLTVIGLLAGSVTCLVRFFRLRKNKNAWFLLVTAGMGFLLFFAAGEEISWAQRILGIHTPEYFNEHNAQKELNIHNLVVGGVKINKLVFSLVLTAVLSIYLIVFPLLYHWKKSFSGFFNFWGVPVARLYQVIAFLLLFGATSLLHHGKNAELLECGAALLFFLIVLNPVNKDIFKQDFN
jgi:hypothetical protein